MILVVGLLTAVVFAGGMTAVILTTPDMTSRKYSIEACAVHGGIKAESATALMCKDRAEWMDDGYGWVRVDVSR